MAEGVSRRRRGGAVARILNKGEAAPEPKAAAERVAVREVPLSAIEGHPAQPRQHRDATALEELARSIEAHGLLQPIVVMAKGDHFTLVAGSRRLAAHHRLGRASITASVLPAADMDTLAIVENLQRRDLMPIEEAEALERLKRERKLTLAQLRAIVGKSVSYLSEIISVAGLPPTIMDEARAREASGQPVPRGTLVEIARMKDPDAQLKTWRRALREAGGSRRATVRSMRRPTPPPSSPVLMAREIDKLSGALDQVRLTGKTGGRMRSSLRALRERIDRLLGDD